MSRDITVCPRGDLNLLEHLLEAREVRRVESVSPEFIRKILRDAGTPRGSHGKSGRTCPTRLLRRGGDRSIRTRTTPGCLTAVSAGLKAPGSGYSDGEGGDSDGGPGRHSDRRRM